jgi:hypothetical protein
MANARWLSGLRRVSSWQRSFDFPCRNFSDSICAIGLTEEATVLDQLQRSAWRQSTPPATRFKSRFLRDSDHHPTSRSATGCDNLRPLEGHGRVRSRRETVTCKKWDHKRDHSDLMRLRIGLNQLRYLAWSPSACHASALPAELWPLLVRYCI